MKSRKYLTTSEVKRLISAVEQGEHAARDCCLIWMCFLHGCRVSELNSLRLSDIDLEGKTIMINRLKNGFSTIHPLFEIEINPLQQWLSKRLNYNGSESEWLFLSRQGNRLSRQQIYKMMRKYGRESALSIAPHPHMLRHACGYALADKGIDTRLIQDYLGHRNIRHTVLYTASNSRRFLNIW